MVTSEERRRIVLALRGISDVGPNLTMRSAEEVATDIALAVGLSGGDTWQNLCMRLARLVDVDSAASDEDEEAAQKLAEIAGKNGTEEAHELADDLLCELLEARGFKRTVETFEGMDKWYA